MHSRYDELYRMKTDRHWLHQTSVAHVGVIVRLRRRTGFDTERLKHEFTLPPSVGAIKRILRQ